MLDDAILGLVSRNEVLEFARANIDRYQPWDDFVLESFPEGLTPSGAWDLIEWMRYTLARIATPRPSGSCLRTWYAHAGQLASSLEELAWKTRSGGSLERNMSLYVGRRGLCPPLVREVVCAASRDGLVVDSDDVALAMRQKTVVPQGLPRPLANVLTVMGDERTWLKSLQDGERTLDDLASCIDEGAERLPYNPVPHTGTSYGDDYTWANREYFREALMAERDGTVHPIIRVLLCSEAVWMKPAFARWNNLLEVVLRRMMFEAAGMPVLGYVPYSEPVWAWEMARGGARATPFKFGEAILKSRFGLDVTPFFLQLVSFLEDGVTDMEVRTESERAAYEKCISAVQRDGRLNHRQRALMERLFGDPALEINAYDYRQHADIAASTAYADLRGLVSSGYLSSSVRNRIQTYWIEPTLEERLCG